MPPPFTVVVMLPSETVRVMPAGRLSEAPLKSLTLETTVTLLPAVWVVPCWVSTSRVYTSV